MPDKPTDPAVTIPPVYAILLIIAALAIAGFVFVRATSPADCRVQHSGTVSQSETLDVVRNVGRC